MHINVVAVTIEKVAAALMSKQHTCTLQVESQRTDTSKGVLHQNVQGLVISAPSSSSESVQCPKKMTLLEPISINRNSYNI
eukprot:2927878-Rhodomonas_salina.1